MFFDFTSRTNFGDVEGFDFAALGDVELEVVSLHGVEQNML